MTTITQTISTFSNPINRNTQTPAQIATAGDTTISEWTTIVGQMNTYAGQVNTVAGEVNDAEAAAEAVCRCREPKQYPQLRPSQVPQPPAEDRILNLSLTINVFSVTDTDDVNRYSLPKNAVKDPIVTHPHTKPIWFPRTAHFLDGV